MLFHVKHVHTHETCPAGNPELVKKAFGTVVSPEHASKIGVKLLGSYADAPSHTVYFIIQADSIEKVGSFLLPLLKLGSAQITPITDLAAEVKKKLKEAKKITEPQKKP